MCKKRVINGTTIFLVSLLLGFLGGIYVTRNRPPARSSSLQVATPTQSIAGNVLHKAPIKASRGQYNLLFIAVDDLSSDAPQLEGIWLVIDMPDNSRLTLLPVYPAVDSKRVIHEPSLTEHFSLNVQKAPSTDFLNTLTSLDLSWDGYIILDRMSLAEMGDPTDMATPTGESTSVERGRLAVSSTNGDSRAILLSQAALIETACKGLSRLPRGDRGNEILNHLSRHLVSNFSTESIVSGLDNLLSANGSLFCEFPVLPTPETIQN
jgi:hypothetical protein